MVAPGARGGGGELVFSGIGFQFYMMKRIGRIEGANGCTIM